jgi:hypothetical protein
MCPMNPRLLRPRASGLTDPRQLASLAVWLDGSDSTTVTLNGSTVSEWRDKSGNARHAAQATAAAQPTYTANDLNGRATLRTAAAQHMVIPAWTYTPSNTALFVFRASNSNQGICQRGTLNDAPRNAVQDPSAAGPRLRTTIHGTNATQVHAEGPAYSFNTWVIGAGVVRTGSVRVYQNGVFGADATYTLQLSGSFDMKLFALNTSNLFGLNGGIAEFIAYDRALSDGEVTQVARYLSRKWNIAIS